MIAALDSYAKYISPWDFSIKIGSKTFPSRPAVYREELVVMGDRRAIFSDRTGRFLIRASSPDFFGVRCGVQFEKGIGHTDDHYKASELEQMGFWVSCETGGGGKDCGKSEAIGGSDATV